MWEFDSLIPNHRSSKVAADFFRGVAQLVARLVRDQEAVGSNPVTPTMQSVLIGSEYPVMDTLLFYVENGEKPELSLLTHSRRHSSLTLCSVSRSMYCFVMPQSRPIRSRLLISTTFIMGVPSVKVLQIDGRHSYFLHSVHVWVGEQKEGSAEIDSRDWLPWDKLSQGADI